MSDYIPFEVSHGELPTSRRFRIYFQRDVFSAVPLISGGVPPAALDVLFSQGGPTALPGPAYGTLSFPLTAVAASSFEPPGALQPCASDAGVWKITMRDGRIWEFRFTTVQDMKLALHQAALPLGALLSVNVSWDADRKIFVRK